MLHLAQVQAQDSTGQTQLQLLAHQKTEPIWELQSTEDAIVVIDCLDYAIGVLLLLDLSSEGEVTSVQSATPWVMELVKQYLTTTITPAWLQQEEQRAEQWRQSLTLQSQEIGRRALEMEARRDQIQDLEEKLKQEKQLLEQQAIELETWRKEIAEMQAATETEKQQLQQRIAELEDKLNAG